MTKMILHARSTNKLSQKFAIQVTARSLFLSILGDSWKLIQDPQGTHFAFAFGSKFANHLVATKSISVFKVQKDAHFVFSSKMIQGPQGTHFPFAFESKFANHLFATKSIWVSNSRFKFQKVRILPSVLGQSYKNPQMVTQNDNYKKWVIWGWLTPRTLHFCNCRCYGGDRRRLIFYSRAGLHWPYKVSLWLVIIKLSVILNLQDESSIRT